jgi:CBS domain-containing protein
VAALTAAGRVRDPVALELALAEQRARDVVPAGPDVLLPHHRTTAVDELVVALGVSPDGVTAPGLAVRPRVITLILAPAQAPALYLQTVSLLARWLKDAATVERLAAAASPDDVRALAESIDLRIQPRLTVRDIMVHSIETVTPGTPARQAVELMVSRRIRALPVVGEKQEVLGVVSEWDVMRGLLPQIPRAGQESGASAIPESMRVRDIMTRSVLCITEDLGIEEAANMMINKDVEQFPVTSEGKLTGFVTRGDIIRKLFGR